MQPAQPDHRSIVVSNQLGNIMRGDPLDALAHTCGAYTMWQQLD